MQELSKFWVKTQEKIEGRGVFIGFVEGVNFA